MKTALLAAMAAAIALAQQDRQVLRPEGAKPANEQLSDGSYVIRAGARIPLTVLNSVSSKHSQPGDQVYLQTMIPVAVAGKIVIPVGTYVTGTITNSKRPGKVKGRGEIGMRFESLLFPSGTTASVTGRIGALDGENAGELMREEGTVKSESSAGKDALVIAGSTVGGAAMGTWIGDRGRGSAIGGGTGGLIGVVAVLLTRGPDAVLTTGSSVEMVLTTDMKLTDADAAGKSGAERKLGATP